jgi:hypothetical protein
VSRRAVGPPMRRTMSSWIPDKEADLVGNLQMDPNINRRNPKRTVTQVQTAQMVNSAVTRIQTGQMAIQKNQT